MQGTKQTYFLMILVRSCVCSHLFVTIKRGLTSILSGIGQTGDGGALIPVLDQGGDAPADQTSLWNVKQAIHFCMYKAVCME